MKKITIAIVLVLLGVMVSTTYASAVSVFQFSPANVNTNPGKTFTLKVTLDPQGIKNYTSKMEIDFPANILKVNSFTFGSNWTAVSQTGYDLTDNNNGILIKTAGYPGGISSPVTFGTISFTTKKEGSGVITVIGNSFVLGAAGQNILSSNPMQASVVVKAAAITPTTPTTSTTPAEEATPIETATPQQTEESVAAPSIPAETALQAGLLTTVMNVLSLGTGETWLSVVLLVLIVIIAVFGILWFAKKTTRKK